MPQLQYSLHFPSIPSTNESEPTHVPVMAKSKSTPSLFDSELLPEERSRTFAERFTPAPARPFTEKVRPSRPSLFDEVNDEQQIREEPLALPPPEVIEPVIASGEKAKAKDILAAIWVLQAIERERRPATSSEKEILGRFPGFGAVALSMFPNPVTGEYKDSGWKTFGEELRRLLNADEYESARRTVFNAFYTSPTVIKAMHQALKRLGVPEDALVLEPGCGTGSFISLAPDSMRFIGVEQDSISGRIARARNPTQDIRIQDFQKTRLPELDAVIGNVPFADVRLDYHGQKLALHDFFIAKSVDSLKPGGVLALVTSHYTLDKLNGSVREYLADRADFLGAIRLPSDAFKREGTSVVSDIVFMRKRSLDEPPRHVDEWLKAEPTEIEGTTVPINRYFLNHPENVLGTYSSKDSLYGSGYSVISNGDMADQLREAVGKLPRFEQKAEELPAKPVESVPRFVPPPAEPHISEGSFFVHDSRIHQMVDGQTVPVVYGGSELWAHGGLVGRRMGALIGLRDLARRVLQSQNEGWPAEARVDARRKLNLAYESFKSAFGPINKTTVSESKDGTQIRRMPNIVKFREDPDAMLVMALEEYDEATGDAKKAPIMQRDVVGKTPPITSVSSAEEGLLVSLDQKGAVDLPFISQLYGKAEAAVISELGELIFHDPETKTWETADAYLSGNVRAKLVVAEKAGIERNIEALKAVQPEDVLPGDIDANLGAPWVPVTDVQAFATELFRVEPDSITIGHLAKDAVWSVEGDYSAERSVAVTADYGTSRASGIWLLGLALNMKSPVIYDPDPSDPDKRVVNQDATLAAKEKQRAIKEQFKSWVFTDPDRTERLVRLYNDNFNNLRPRQFDGSHLDFPGMSQALALRQHQKDAVWRIMSGGNTLLAHAVGAGKTGACSAGAMKLKQAGLAKKSLIAVPNHLLEQFAREFQQFYPNAKLLVASKDDFTKERRKFLTAKIASGTGMR
ncbi:putative DNA methylase [Fimbriiglobus ruber]|uniref:Putative DNA methylase n=1 Tax=Fimbriiglobus ruber TaxID=1908690 RepID=A0A225E107_9BACT|nr:putative DNA methylase [Fimbriiglobus ruber]